MRVLNLLIFVASILGACATSQQSPAIKQSTDSAKFSIIPNTSVYAEASINGDGRISLTKVEHVANPNITLAFRFTRTQNGMKLTVENPLSKTIKYHLDMVDDRGKSRNTSSCPVRAGNSVFEFWPHSISEIRVSNTHVALKNEEGACVY